MNPDRWWVFDKPLLRDPLFVVGLLAGVISMVARLQSSDEMGGGAIAITLIGSILAVGIVLGSIREFIRGRRSA